MPRPSIVMIRAALVWMLMGYTVGGLLLVSKALNVFPAIWLLRPAHIYILLIGWLVQLSAGVMIWIMPRHVATSDRGDLRPAWVCCMALNVAVTCAALATPLATWLPGSAPWIWGVSGVCLLAALGGLIGHLWPRVRPVLPATAAASKGTS